MKCITRLISLLFIFILVINAQLSPAADSKLKIHILGDSITQSKSQNYCWRYWVWLKLKDNGLNNLVDFVGSSSGPGSGWDSEHDGHWGWTSQQILKSLRDWAPRFKGDIALIHLGSNDMKEPDIIKIVDGFREIISVLRVSNASVRIVVGQIPSWSTGRDEKVGAFNKELLTLKELDTKESPIRVIDLTQGYDRETDAYDNMHPNESGAKKYAEAFYPALVNMINYNPDVTKDLTIYHIKRNPVAHIHNSPSSVTALYQYQLNGQRFIRIPTSPETRRFFLNVQGKRENLDEYSPR